MQAVSTWLSCARGRKSLELPITVFIQCQVNIKPRCYHEGTPRELLNQLLVKGIIKRI
jgi:hypothetical protein